MPLYEHVFLARQDITAQQVTALQTQFQTVIEESGGKIGKTEYWGLKSLAYKIKKNRKAHYTLVNIDAPHEAVAEMERQMSLSPDIIRFITIRVKELDEKQSAMMKRSDDRGEKSERRGPRREGRDFRSDRPDFRSDRGDRGEGGSRGRGDYNQSEGGDE